MHMMIQCTVGLDPNPKTNRGPLKARKVKNCATYSNFRYFRPSPPRFPTVMIEPKVFFFTKEAETPRKMIQMNMSISSDKEKLRN